MLMAFMWAARSRRRVASVIMAQTGAVTANSGSAWGIKANNIIYGKIGVDIYNGGAVTAAQTLSNLSVSAYGVQLIGAVWNRRQFGGE